MSGVGLAAYYLLVMWQTTDLVLVHFGGIHAGSKFSSLNGLGIYRSSVKLCMMQTDSYKVSTCVIHVYVNVGEYLCVCKASSLVSLCGQQLHNIIMVLIKTNVQLRSSLQPGNLVHSLLKYTVLCSHTS